ncbi:MAG: hypothetical protein NPIRA04_29540 [Nitrospirales bacterium]|nr:MAG: hypothetical protein NPIRA04_29540 [Nitrospirales bacterium]
MPRLSFIRSHVIIAVLCIVWAISGLAHGEEPILRELSQTHQSDLLTIASDNAALNFYKKNVYQARNISRHSRNTSHTPPEPDIPHHRITLVANLLASRLAVHIQTTIQEQKVKDIRPFSEQQPAVLKWLRNKAIPHTVTKMLDFQKHVESYVFQDTLSSEQIHPSQFDKFATYVDQHYPTLTGQEESWVGMLEHGNLSGISQRLSEYWKLESSHDPQAITSQANVDNFEYYYVRTRLWPVFKSHLIALTIQADAEAMQFAKQSMTQITKEQNAHILARNRARVCGTWHWTVHNHQNHADHKMTVFFGDPAKSPTKQPQPVEMKINGETVYLLWKFPNGFQEDSLLLSQDDKRLEGTFHNTLGPHGSISGKRLSSCKP